MSILIKDMEIPESCSECRIGCSGMCKHMTIGNILQDTKSEDCPMQEVLTCEDDYCSFPERREGENVVDRSS